MRPRPGGQAGPMTEFFDRVALTGEDDRAYVAGAVVERALAARERGERYTFEQFVREALIEAAHQ